MKKYTIGEWKLTHEDGNITYIKIKNNAQAKFITDNMGVLCIKEWQAKEGYGDTADFYELK